MELTLYLENGKTLRFENVNDLKRDENYYNRIKFSYVSMSDGKKKYAFFTVKSLLGLSTDKEDFDVNNLH